MGDEKVFELEVAAFDIADRVYGRFPHIAWLAVSSELNEESAATVVAAATGIGSYLEQYQEDRFRHRPQGLEVWKLVMQEEMARCRMLNKNVYKEAKGLSREVFRLFYTLDELTSPSFLQSLQRAVESK